MNFSSRSLFLGFAAIAVALTLAVGGFIAGKVFSDSEIREIEVGDDANETEDDEWLGSLQQQAENGTASSQYALGALFEHGAGVSKDTDEAIAWYRLAAEQNHPGAQYSLGQFYHEGLAVPQDFAEALKWYQAAARRGNVGAQYQLGVMHARGEGTPQDQLQAEQWILKAAERGHAVAQFNLGMRYLFGSGGTGKIEGKDYMTAHIWFNLAASRFSDADSREEAGKNRDYAAREMTEEQIAEAQRRARIWMPKK